MKEAFEMEPDKSEKENVVCGSDASPAMIVLSEKTAIRSALKDMNVLSTDTRGVLRVEMTRVREGRMQKSAAYMILFCELWMDENSKGTREK